MSFCQIQQKLQKMRNTKSAGSSTKATSLFANLSPNRNEQLAQDQFRQISNKQVFFLKVKNRELQEGAIRLAERILELQKSNEELLKINERYVAALNQHFTHKHGQFEQQMKKIKSHPFCKNCNRAVLTEFEKDYRNLVKYTFILKDEIESKNNDLTDYEQMKRELSKTNHTQISTLITELIESSKQVVQLKKELNRVQFQVEKFKAEAQKVKRNSKSSKQTTNLLEEQLQKYKSLINTIQNQSIDKAKILNQKIYQQELIIQNMQENMRQAENDKNMATLKQEELRVQNLELNLRSNQRSYSQSKVIGLKKMQDAQKEKETWFMKIKKRKE